MNRYNTNNYTQYKLKSFFNLELNTTQKYFLDFKKLKLDLPYVKALGSFSAGFPKIVTVGSGGIGSYPIYIIR